MGMKITKIEKQKKDRQRYSVFLDGEFAFGLYEDSLVKYGLRTGDELDEKKIEEIKKYDEFGFGKKVAYSFLSYKQRSRNEIVKKLKQKKVSDNTIDEVIELLLKQKYIDDKTYAKNYIDDKINSKPIGKRLAKLKLFEKGIDKELIEETLNESYTEETETELAVRLLSKYEKKLKSDDPLERKSKCFRYLLSKGFDYETIRRAINND